MYRALARLLGLCARGVPGVSAPRIRSTLCFLCHRANSCASGVGRDMAVDLEVERDEDRRAARSSQEPWHQDARRGYGRMLAAGNARLQGSSEDRGWVVENVSCFIGASVQLCLQYNRQHLCHGCQPGYRPDKAGEWTVGSVYNGLSHNHNVCCIIPLGKNKFPMRLDETRVGVFALLGERALGHRMPRRHPRPLVLSGGCGRDSLWRRD
mmetsp:Transcript_16025/g.47590  ORF Transcript_16025/g.47590 Transcript_16025/m.47590 type:complete len:210 (+) Transcript_16025:164-793(+)